MDFIKETDDVIATWSDGDIEGAIFDSPEEYIHANSRVRSR